jgi:CubicO group peptidase (beta-lactamase class C family)
LTRRPTLESHIQSLLGRNLFPGISILAARDDRIILNRSFGDLSLEPVRQPLDHEAIYDLASLTKPLVTALLTLYLMEREKLNLETPISSILPEIPHAITPLQLLCHTSGLPAWYPFYLFGRAYLPQYKTLKLESKPGSRVNYSCPGYILLHLALQEAAGTEFQALARQVIFEPLGLEHTFFRVPDTHLTFTAPTEKGNRYERGLCQNKFAERSRDFPWRTEMIRGEAHDTNSFFLGGTAGNAGLFSTTTDIFKISREFFPASATILKPETTRLFWRNQTAKAASHRTVGFKRNSSLLTSGGRALTRDSIGHNGFTGTSIWLEPGTRTVFILLSNRIHPVYKSLNFNRIRRKLHKIIRLELGV